MFECWSRNQRNSSEGGIPKRREKDESAKEEKKDKNYYGSRSITSFQLDIANVVRNIGNILKIQDSKEKENKETVKLRKIIQRWKWIRFNCIRAYSTSQSPKIQDKKKVRAPVKLRRCFSATKIRQKRIFPTPLTVRTATIEFQRRKSAVGWRTRVVAVHQEALTHSVDIPVDIFDVALCSITRPRDHRMCTPVFVSLPLPHSVSLSLSRARDPRSLLSHVSHLSI